MFKRTLTILLLIPPTVYVIGWSPEWLFVLVVALAVVLALREYFALCRAMGFKVFAGAGYSASLLLCLVQVLPLPFRHTAILILLELLVLLMLTFAMRRADLKDYLGDVSLTVFGFLYVGLALSCLVPIRFSEASFGYPWMAAGGTTEPSVVLAPPIFLLFVVIWAGDISAYLIGRWIGRIPFFARISPHKTWEGALAGLAGSLLAAWVFGHWFWTTVSLKTIILLAAWIAVAGQAGDLVESAMKRGAHQKDSGTLLPGHGGFLDRIDSLLFGAPALWLALTLMENLR